MRECVRACVRACVRVHARICFVSVHACMHACMRARGRIFCARVCVFVRACNACDACVRCARVMRALARCVRALRACECARCVQGNACGVACMFTYTMNSRWHGRQAWESCSRSWQPITHPPTPNLIPQVQIRARQVQVPHAPTTTKCVYNQCRSGWHTCARTESNGACAPQDSLRV